MIDPLADKIATIQSSRVMNKADLILKDYFEFYEYLEGFPLPDSRYSWVIDDTQTDTKNLLFISTDETDLVSFFKLPVEFVVDPEGFKAAKIHFARNVGVHITHCCLMHGCKYNDDSCPVEDGDYAQDYPCEFCVDPEEARIEINSLKEEIDFVERISSNRGKRNVA